MRYCPNCGRTVKAGAKYCMHCIKPLDNRDEVEKLGSGLTKVKDLAQNALEPAGHQNN